VSSASAKSIGIEWLPQSPAEESSYAEFDSRFDKRPDVLIGEKKISLVVWPEAE